MFHGPFRRFFCHNVVRPVKLVLPTYVDPTVCVTMNTVRVTPANDLSWGYVGREGLAIVTVVSSVVATACHYIFFVSGFFRRSEWRQIESTMAVYFWSSFYFFHLILRRAVLVRLLSG